MSDSPLLPGLLRARPGPITLTGLLALVAIALVLVAPARTLAHTHHSACPATSAKQRAHHARACARAGHRTKTHTRRAGRLRLIAPAAAGRRGGTRGSGRRGPTGAAPSTSAAPSDELPASCEDGSEPALTADETFGCDDGSEPSCDDGSELILSGDGSKLLCSGSEPATEAEPSEPEDGGEPADDSAAPPRQPSAAASSHRSIGS